MTVGELALLLLAFVVLAGGGLWLYAWWQTRHWQPPDNPHDGEWPK